MKTTVALIGGGLAGLHAARLLHAAGVDFQLFEARDRLGGRILTADEHGRASDDGFDLGPSWFWPEMQRDLAALVQELGLATFAQSSEGDGVFERMSHELPQRFQLTQPPPVESMRLAGGTGALVNALAGALPGERLHLGSRVTGAALQPDGVTLAISAGEGEERTVVAEQVIAALPPRLFEARVSLEPVVEPATARRWRETDTWMAPHAKFFALYDRAFWREAGLSGTAQSLVGPLAEIHDATTASGAAALFGFVGVGADKRAEAGEATLTRACLEQLARLFGPQAQRPRTTLLKDWAIDDLTATRDDRAGGGHPQPQGRDWVSGAWRDRLSFGGSETSPTEPGYLAGAIDAARLAVAETLERMKVWLESDS